MSKLKTWSMLAALPLLSSCGLIDDIKQNLNEAISQLTAVSQGNLQQLIGTNAESMEKAGEQLNQLKSGAAKPQSDGAPRGFSLGGGGTAPSLRTQQNGDNQGGSLFDQINDLAECIVVTRADDPAARVRKLTADYSDCDDQAGTITSELTESNGLDLNIEFADYLEDGRTTNGTVDWTIDITLGDEAEVLITANQQLTVSGLAPAAAKLAINQTAATTVTIPHLVIGGTINYTIEPEGGVLKIAGTSTFTQGQSNASVNFASIVFDFDIDKDGEDTGCNDGPSEGSISMTGDGGTLSIKITGCGKATVTNPDGSTAEMSADDVNEIFEDTLKALIRMFENVNKVVLGEKAKNYCSQNDADDTSEDNDNQNAAFDLRELPASGLAQAGQILTDEDWYKVKILTAGQYFAVATPKTCFDLWPFICVVDSSGSELGEGCGQFAGWFAFQASANQDVFIRIYDPWSEYTCVNYQLDIFKDDPNAPPPQLPVPSCDASGPGAPGQCPREWINDGVCDAACEGVWGEPDGQDCSGGNLGSCPLAWLGDTVCDYDCIPGWQQQDLDVSAEQNVDCSLTCGTAKLNDNACDYYACYEIWNPYDNGNYPYIQGAIAYDQGFCE